MRIEGEWKGILDREAERAGSGKAASLLSGSMFTACCQISAHSSLDGGGISGSSPDLIASLAYVKVHTELLERTLGAEARGRIGDAMRMILGEMDRRSRTCSEI